MACRSRWHTRSAEQQETPGCECRGFRHAREFPLVIPYCVRSDESRNIVLTTESPTGGNQWDSGDESHSRVIP